LIVAGGSGRLAAVLAIRVVFPGLASREISISEGTDLPIRQLLFGGCGGLLQLVSISGA
jgi:hypothetical protein